MHSYKSLVVVAGLLSVLLLLAGVLLQVEKSPKKSKGETSSEQRDYRSNFTKLDYGGSLGSVKPDKGHFDKDIAVIRAAMKPGENSFVHSGSDLKIALAHGQAVVSPSDFPLIEKEFARKDNSAAYESILIIMLGASKAEKGLPILEAQYAKHPIRVIEALRLNGTMAACGIFCRIYAGSKTHQERYCILQALKKLPASFAESFLIERLSDEMDAHSLKDAVNLTRFLPSESLVAALAEFVSSDSDRSKPLMGLACNALAAQVKNGGAEALFDLHLNPNNSLATRTAAGNAIAFLKAPDSVQDVLNLIVELPESSFAIAKFLQRNAREEHLEAMKSFLNANKSPWQKILAPIIDRLTP